jgi:hypothetical protein
MRKSTLAYVGAVTGFGAFLATAAASLATSTYDVTPVITGMTSDLSSNVPIVLTAVGALIALAIIVRGVRKFVHL